MKPISKLTKTEQHILDLYLDGYVNSEICKILNIQSVTVKKHTSNILAKYNQPSIFKLVVAWYKDAIGV